MNRLFFRMFFVVICCMSITVVSSHASQPEEIEGAKDIYRKYNLVGSFLLYDYNKNEYMVCDPDRCNTGFSPASTFKIPNTLIALETGVITPQTIFHWEGEKRRNEKWEADMDITQAYKVSNVPVYQEIARKIGLQRMQYYVSLLHYGEMDICADNLDMFWLEGRSTITQFQQIYFLKQLYEQRLPLKQQTMNDMKQIMCWEETEDYILYAKTGWSDTGEKEYAWLTGYYVMNNGNVYFFANVIEKTDQTDMTQFGSYRMMTTREILSGLLILK